MKKIVARRHLIVLAPVVIAAVVVGGWRFASHSTRDRAHNNKGAAQMASKTIQLDGVHLDVPAGWSSESFVNSSGMSVFRVGSFSFPHASNDDVGQTARASMRPNDVLVNVVDVTATDPGTQNSAYKPLTGPLTVSADEAQQQEGFTVSAAVIRGVRINGHNFYVSVSFGSTPPSRAQLSAANGVLRSLGTS
jgi:hypothetical protein